MVKVKHLAKKNLTSGGGNSCATTHGGDGFRARNAMPSTERLGIYESPFSLFAKLIKL